MPTTKTKTRSSPLVALELEDLRARRAELQADLDTAHNSYNELKRGVIARTAKTQDAQKARSELDTINGICDEVSAQIATMEDELAAVEAGEAHAKKLARIRELASASQKNRADSNAARQRAAQTLEKITAELEKFGASAQAHRRDFAELMSGETEAILPELEAQGNGLDLLRVQNDERYTPRFWEIPWHDGMKLSETPQDFHINLLLGAPLPNVAPHSPTIRSNAEKTKAEPVGSLREQAQQILRGRK